MPSARHWPEGDEPPSGGCPFGLTDRPRPEDGGCHGPRRIGRARGRLQRREPRAATRAAPYVALLPTDSCYGHVCGLLFTPVQIVSSLFG